MSGLKHLKFKFLVCWLAGVFSSFASTLAWGGGGEEVVFPTAPSFLGSINISPATNSPAAVLAPPTYVSHPGFIQCAFLTVFALLIVPVGSALLKTIRSKDD